MSLSYYIPNIRSSFNVGGDIIPIEGIYDFRIEVEKLKAQYGIYINVNNADSLIPIRGTICMGENDVSKSAIFVINNNSINCYIERIFYHHVKHLYLVSFSILLDNKKIKDVIPVSPKDKKISRIDILDV